MCPWSKCHLPYSWVKTRFHPKFFTTYITKIFTKIFTKFCFNQKMLFCLRTRICDSIFWKLSNGVRDGFQNKIICTCKCLDKRRIHQEREEGSRGGFMGCQKVWETGGVVPGQTGLKLVMNIWVRSQRGWTPRMFSHIHISFFCDVGIFLFPSSH